MVLSDGMVHFLKIKNFFKQIYQNYLVALIVILPQHYYIFCICEQRNTFIKELLFSQSILYGTFIIQNYM